MSSIVTKPTPAIPSEKARRAVMLIVLCTFLVAGAQVAMKMGADYTKAHPGVTGIVTNPLLIGGIVWAAMDYDCLFAGKSGWNCLFSDVGPFVAGMSLIPPLIGLVGRWGSTRRA